MKNVQHDLLADAQQKAGELTPYVLYIPVKFTQKEFEELMKAKVN